MIRIVTAVFLAAIISTSFSQCPTEGLTVPMSSVLSLARNVLLGRDVTPTESCSFGDLKLCRRRQIKFEVFCTLKKMDNFAMQAIYYIGENRTVGRCDATFMEYNDRNNIMIVLVKYQKMDDGQGRIDWEEVVPGQRAIFKYDNVTIGSAFNATCGLGTFLRGSNSNSDGFCPTQSPIVECHNRFSNLLTVIFQNSEEEKLGNQCCRELSTRRSDISVNETAVDTVITSHAVSKIPLIYLGAFRPDFFLASNDLVTVAMVAVSKNVTMVHWLVANVKFQSDGKLLLHEGLTIAPYAGIIPEVKNVEGHIQVFRQVDFIQNASLPLCESPCNMDIKLLQRVNNLNLFASTDFSIEMDDYAVWNLIIKKQFKAKNVCREFDSTLKPYKEIVLCPQATTGGATDQKLFHVLTWCLFYLIGHHFTF